MQLLVIAGFLGAGKTSLLLEVAKHLSAAGRRIAIIENEIGKVGIDDKFLADRGLNIREIYGGCVCCTLAVNLLTTLKMLEEQVRPDVVIVEPSGVAGPDSIRRSIAGYRGDLRASHLLVLFDAERFKALSVVAGPFVEASINAADMLVVNKCDVVPGEQAAALIDRLCQLRPDVRALAVSVKTGRNLARLIERLDARLAEVENTPTVGAASTDRDDDHHHHHPGEPIAEARQWTVPNHEALPADVLKDEVSSIIVEIARQIEREDGAVIGHVKCLIESDGQRCLLRTTTTARPPDIDGSLPASVTAAGITLNAIGYQIDRERLAGITDEAIAASAIAPADDTATTGEDPA